MPSIEQPEFQNSMAVLDHATANNFYAKLLAQLQKDLHRTNLDLEIAEDMAPEALKNTLQTFIGKLLELQYEQLFQFLYVVDVSEQDMLRITRESHTNLSELCTLLVLKRTWQKVWYRNIFRHI